MPSSTAVTARAARRTAATLAGAALAACSVPQQDLPLPLLAIVGDTQRTSAAERLVGREQNDAERAVLLRHLAAESPQAVVHLGDLVFDAASADEWADFEVVWEPVRRTGATVYVVLGNHEYWGGSAAGVAEAVRRFPTLLGGSWYSARWQALGLVVLDSNQAALGSQQWAEQCSWYRDTLAAMDADPLLRGVLVFAHHPPFTNSTVTGDEVHVQRDFVPPFLASRKTMALVAGHAHAYEHFLIEGRHFLVSGGGGGPRVRLLEGSARRHQDLFQGPSPRPFHYLACTPAAGGLALAVRGLDRASDELATIEEFVLPYPR